MRACGCWPFLAGRTLLLSLGPYVPGFRYLIMVPGFSFFRAPSRWSVATALALALLAGKGFDRWRRMGPSRPLAETVGRDVRSAGWASTLGLIELALLCTGKPGWPEVAGVSREFSLRCRGRESRALHGPCTGATAAGGPAHRVRAIPDDPAAQIDGGAGLHGTASSASTSESSARRRRSFLLVLLTGRG